MKKAFVAFLFLSALIVGFTFHVTESALFVGPEPTANVQIMQD